MHMPRFKMDALGGSRATSGKNNRQLNNGTASFMETTPEIDRPRLPTEMANAPPSAPPPSDGKGFVYWARFDPPLQTRAYPHLGDHVLVGWLLLTERPLPPMARSTCGGARPTCTRTTPSTSCRGRPTAAARTPLTAPNGWWRSASTTRSPAG